MFLHQGRGKYQAPRQLPRPRHRHSRTLCTPWASPHALGHLLSQQQVPPAASTCAGPGLERVLGSPSFPAAFWWPSRQSRRGCGAGTQAPQVPRGPLESERGRHAWDQECPSPPASALRAERPHRTFWCPLADGLAVSDSRGALDKCSLWSPRALRSSSRTAEVNFLTRHSVVTTAKSKL